MKFLIDADACPVTKIVENIAKMNDIELLLVCDTSHIITVDYGEVIVVSKGNDSADFYLVNKVSKGDIVVTGDYGVAAMALAKGGHPIHHSGKWFTSDNIDQMLFERHMSKKARKGSNHYRGKGPKKRTPLDDKRFYESFLSLLSVIRS